MSITRESMAYDVVIVGAGPSGLATAIHLKQLAKLENKELNICVLDKGSEVGSHIISGAIMNPQGLNELIPNWRELNFPVKTLVQDEKLYFLSQNSKFPLPTPKDFQNEGNYIISLSQLCRSLAEYAESLGVEIYPGFAVSQLIIKDNIVHGVITQDVGINKDSSQSSNYQPGMEILAKQTVLAEGARGSTTQQAIKAFNLARSPQTYGLGIKEIWRINPKLHKPGRMAHYIGYPLNNNAYGGGFIYHLDNNLISIGLVTSLDYKNPYLSPYEEFQRFKSHPKIKKLLLDGERLEYGARVVSEGGLQSLPALIFPGGIIVGDSAGFLNVPKIKGIHNAIKSGMLGALGVIEAINNNTFLATKYPEYFKASWLYQDLYQVRNIRPAFRLGLYFGIFYTLVEKYILRNKAFWTFKFKITDRKKLKHKSQVKPINYPSYDNMISFDKASSLHLANLTHQDNQPTHLKLKDPALAIKVNLIDYAAPETKFCPAGVYEIVKIHNKLRLQINPQNCVHCKACDIKDVSKNITWSVPEGGSGPQYSDM